MTIDIRADIYCSLGPVISGSFSDDYIQDSGLIKTRGEVVLNGLFRPGPGTVVEFAYVRSGVGSRLPRKLRVLSVFADPYRGTTTVALGCKLTYLEGRKPPLKNPTSVDENGVTPPDVIAIASLPISAAYVFDRCLEEIGLEASSNPLTNKFSVEEFSLDSGYIAVISDLLKSEGYFGYVDETETLVVCSFNDAGGLGPLINSDSIIDLAPIDVGELPGDSVVVNYSYLKLAPPRPSGGSGTPTEEAFGRDYTVEKTIGSEEIVRFNTTYKDPFGVEKEKEIEEKYHPCSETVQKYELIEIINKDTGNKEKKWLLTLKTQRTNGHFFDACAGINDGAAQFFKGAFIPWFSGTYEKVNITTYERDKYGDVKKEITEETVPQIIVRAAAPIPWADYFRDTGLSLAAFNQPDTIASRTITEYEYNEELDKTTTTTFNYKAKVSTSEGQNDFGRRLERAQALGDVQFFATCSFVLIESDRLVFDSSSVNISIGRGALDNDPANGDSPDVSPLVQEETAGLEWIDGSSDSQLVTTFSVPYSGDDYLTNVSGTGPTLTYTIVRSNAGVQARNYGNIQNRLLLGNRNGLSIQISADNMPPRPFAPIYVESGGFVGEFRSNGTSYTFDANGIVASTDCLFWGAVGEL